MTSHVIGGFIMARWINKQPVIAGLKIIYLHVIIALYCQQNTRMNGLWCHLVSDRTTVSSHVMFSWAVHGCRTIRHSKESAPFVLCFSLTKISILIDIMVNGIDGCNLLTKLVSYHLH